MTDFDGPTFAADLRAAAERFDAAGSAELDALVWALFKVVGAAVFARGGTRSAGVDATYGDRSVRCYVSVDDAPGTPSTSQVHSELSALRWALEAQRSEQLEHLTRLDAAWEALKQRKAST